MQQNFTPELLVKHLYNETNANETQLVENALEQNEAIRQEFKDIESAKLALDEADGHEPSKSIIDNILAFSKKTATETV